jgi:tetratricopeptide (TPR) repeat protein
MKVGQFFAALIIAGAFLISSSSVFAVERLVPGQYSSYAAEQLEQAEVCHNKKDYSTAAALYHDIIEQYPGTTDAFQARKGLTVLLIDSKDYSEAEAAFEDLIKVFARHPNLPAAIYEIGRKYEAARRRDSAQGLYEFLIKTYPDDVYVLWAKGRMVVLKIEFGDAAGAQRAMDELIADSATHPDVVQLFAHIRGHRPVKYRTYWVETYRQTDDGAKVRIGGGGGPAQNWEEEQQLYEYVVEHHPGTVYTLHALKNLAFRHIHEVRHHPERIVVSKAGTREVYLLNEERLEQAQACVDKLFEDFSRHPDFPGVVFDLAERYKSSLDERPEFAEKLYRYLIDKHKDTEYPMKAQKSLILLYLRTGEKFKGIKALQELLRANREDPNLPRLVYDIGFYLEMEGLDNPDRAEPVYRYLVEEYPKTRYGVLAKGRLLCLEIKRGDDKSLLAGLEGLMRDIEKGKATPKAILDVARSFAYASNHTREIEVLEFLCEEFPDSPEMCDALYRIGYSYRQLKDYDMAVEYSKRVLNEYPNSKYTRYLRRFIGDLYQLAGEAEQALYWYDLQSELSNDELSADRALFGKYTVYRDLLKDYDKAIEVLREYQQKFPAGSHAGIIPYALGRLCEKGADTEKAIAVLEEGLAACQDAGIAEKYREKLVELPKIK